MFKFNTLENIVLIPLLPPVNIIKSLKINKIFLIEQFVLYHFPYRLGISYVQHLSRINMIPKIARAPQATKRYYCFSLALTETEVLVKFRSAE